MFEIMHGCAKMVNKIIPKVYFLIRFTYNIFYPDIELICNFSKILFLQKLQILPIAHA